MEDGAEIVVIRTEKHQENFEAKYEVNFGF